MKDVSFSTALLEWYASHKRVLPWRQEAPIDPYKVWISEIMLQQTTVQTVEPYFLRFMERFPDVQALAEASIEDVLWFWQGLGYYRRAHLMHKAAKSIVDSGIMPQTHEAWLALPGIGHYTAAAILSIAFEKPYAAVDGNIHRILSRYKGWTHTPQAMVVLAADLLPKKCFGDYTQALMDLGAQICKAKNPLCALCPIAQNCYARKEDCVEKFPPKKIRLRKNRYAHMLILKNKKGEFWIEKNEKNALLKGLWGVLSSSWDLHETICPWDAMEKTALGTIKHIFTHFTLDVDVWRVDYEEGLNPELDERLKAGQWVENMKEYAISSLMRKVTLLACL